MGRAHDELCVRETVRKETEGEGRNMYGKGVRPAAIYPSYYEVSDLSSFLLVGDK